MKKEMDSYLGRDGGSGMIKKHLDRDMWLNNNKEKICKFLKIDTNLTVKSYMVTSEVIPTIYIKAEALPMPIIAFPDLKRKGVNRIKQEQIIDYLSAIDSLPENFGTLVQNLIENGDFKMVAEILNTPNLKPSIFEYYIENILNACF